MNKKVKYVIIALVVYFLIGLVYLGASGKLSVVPSTSEAGYGDDDRSVSEDVPDIFEPAYNVIVWVIEIIYSEPKAGGGGDGPQPRRR